VNTPASIHASTLAHDLRRYGRIALVLMIPLVFYFTSEGTWRLGKNSLGGGYNGRFFRAQADAIADGRLDVAREDIHSECFDYESRCYGYFGVTPSLLRLPFLPYLHWLKSGLTPLYLGVALLLAYWTALRLVRRGLIEFGHPDVPRGAVLGYFVVAAVALGPGGSLLFLTRPGVFEEAIAWGVAFFLIALERAWAWHATRRMRPLLLAVVFAVAAANARPTTATACASLGVVVAVLSRVGMASAARRQRGVLVAAACLSVLPGLTAAGVFWLKFGTPLPDIRLNEQIPEAPWWADVLRINGERAGGPIFLPTELIAYLRPDGVIWQDSWPYADFGRWPQNTLWVPPLPPGGAYVERMTTATASMPLAWGLNLLVLLSLSATGWRLWVSRGQPASARTTWTAPEWLLATGLLVSAAAMIVLIVTTIGITNRYLAEFFSISVVGMALGHRVIMPRLVPRPALRAIVAVGAVVLSVWSVVVTVLLTVRLLFYS
jgi:hypothetical protein